MVGVKSAHVVEAAETKSPSLSDVQVDYKIRKSTCNSCVVCAVALLERPEVHRRKLAVMTKKDLEIEEEPLQTDPMLAALKHMLDRSCLKLVSVQQYKHAFEEFDWMPDQEVAELSLERSGGIIRTHPRT